MMIKFVRVGALILFAFLAVAPVITAQTQSGVEILLSKARSLESRGRMDLAAQNWKQVLLANPNQTAALAGLARYAKQNGNSDEERSYLDRLKKISPKDPEIVAIEKMHVLTPQERDRLDEAGSLAMQHKPDEAMKIYDQVFGNESPSGKWAEPYYETEAASTGGREKAIAQLRRLVARDKTNEVYRLWLAQVLINDPKTRMEGFQLLESIHDPGTAEQSRALWRQALPWEKENPAALDSVNAYLQRYPDPELQAIQKSLQEKREHAAEEASKEQGFQALRNKNMTAAEAQFQEVLRRSPNDPNAIAGLAFVRLNQKNFEEAVTLFDRARTLSPKRADVREGYETAKFWSLMQQGSTALQQNHPEGAITAYHQALTLHPGDEQATLGIAEAEVRQNRLPDAEAEFQQVLNHSPTNTDAIAGLAFIRLNQKRFDEAVAFFDKARRLVPNRPEIEQGYQNARFWALIQHAAAALDQNQSDVALADYKQALALRPDALDALHGLAGAAERKRDYAQTAQAYTQLTAANPRDVQSWLGLVKAQMAAKNPQQVLATAQRIPPPAKTQLDTRSDFLSELALAYYETNQPDQGDRMLRRATDAAAQSDTTEALNFRLEVASALMEQGKPERAIEVYQQAAKLYPNEVIAWQALVGAYARNHDFAQAKATVHSMPESVYESSTKNGNFLNAVAAIYSADGECNEAEDFLNRSLNLDKAAGRRPPVGTQLQLADIWFREENYAKARQGYHEVLAQDQNSVEAWRGYLTVLHNSQDDRTLLAETQRMPVGVRAQLEKDPTFLTLLAGAQSALGHTEETVQLLQKARSLYESQNQVSPPVMDVQLAWAMLNDQGNDLIPFLKKVKARVDLTEKQRTTIDEIWSTWSVHASDVAMRNRKPDQAIAILTDAQRELPDDPRLYGALATVYVRERDYQKALGLYESWDMRGAQGDDYRAAAGAASAAHKNDLVNYYLEQGLQHFPSDPGLLEMKGKQEIAHGNYNQGQSYLKMALRASKNPPPPGESFTGEPVSLAQPPDTAGRISLPATPGSQAPACRRTTSYAMPSTFHFKLVSASYDEQGDSSQDNANPNPANQNNQEPANPTGSNGQNTGQQPAPNPDNSGQNTANQPSTNENTTQPNTTQQNTASSQGNTEHQQQLQDEIDVVQNRNTPYSDVGSTASGRVGDAGIDRLIVEDAIAGGSVAGGDRVRLSVFAHGLFLYSGTPDGGSRSLFGTLPAGSTFASQSTAGVTGELQLSTATFGLDFGATPQQFPVSNFTGGLRFRPLGGPITFTATRDSVKDSLLSYAGVRDPGTGIVWGGVVSNTGTLQLDHKTRRGGQYASVGYSYFTGKNVPDNWSAFGTAGFYFVVVKNLSVGLSVTGMHYDKNLSFFSLGQGGYFSPQQYGIAAIPISWFSRHKRFEYELRANLGAQYIQQDRSSFFPTRFNITLPPQGTYLASNSTGANYYFLGRLGYRIAPHVYFDIFGTANNANNYNIGTVGFSIKILAHRIPTNTDLHVNSIPDWRGNQPFGIE
jgi:tetratricopeptide (TPR) repeat protein